MQALMAQAEVSFERGRDALTAGSEDAAIELFGQSLEAAHQVPDNVWLDGFEFKVAATIQTEGDWTGIQRMAVASYERILERSPNSPVVWNNLAKLYARMNRAEQAEALFRRAIVAGGEYEVVFRRNYAAFLETEGRASDAVSQYLEILKVYPDDPEANGALIEHLLAMEDAKGLADYCWRQIRRGRAIHIADVALDVAPEVSWGSAEEAPPWGWETEYVSILATALARAGRNPARLLDSPLGTRIAESAPLSPGIDGILALFAGIDDPSLLEPERFGWWAERGSDPFEEDRRWSPRDSFRLLTRSIGGYYRTRGNMTLAESYFALAADLTGSLSEMQREADPDAVLELAEMRFEARDTLGLDSLLAAHGHLLFEDKAVAYMQDDTQRIYRYQRALGTMYARLGRWGESSKPGTANFHLKEAVEAAESYNAESTDRRIQISPELIKFRTEGLIETGNRGEAVDFSLEYAEKLLDSGDKAASTYLYGELIRLDSASTLTTAQHTRLDTLEAKITRQQVKTLDSQRVLEVDEKQIRQLDNRRIDSRQLQQRQK